VHPARSVHESRPRTGRRPWGAPLRGRGGARAWAAAAGGPHLLLRPAVWAPLREEQGEESLAGDSGGAGRV